MNPDFSNQAKGWPVTLFREDIALAGTPIIGSPFIPRDEVFNIEGSIHFHQHTWYSGRKRKPHGRTNGPRRWKVKKRSCDYGFMDKIKAATNDKHN